MLLLTVSALVFAIPMSIYIQTVYPTVAGGDSGELVAESCSLGVAHPPGYPLFILLSNIATKRMEWLGGTPAWRSNMMSCCFASLAGVFVFLSVDLLTRDTRRGNIVVAALAGILYSISPLVWLYAISSEVFAMNNFFAALIVYLTCLFSKKNDPNVAIFGSFCCGLAMCNQHTTVLFQIPLISWFLWILFHQRVLTKALFWRLAGYYLLGLTPYLYLIVAEKYFPNPSSWGNTGTISFKVMWQFGMGEIPHSPYINRKKVVSKRITSIKTLLRDRGRKGESKSTQKKQLSKAQNSIGQILLFTWAFYLIIFHTLSNIPLSQGLLFGVHMRFWMQPNVIIFITFGVGASAWLHVLFDVCRIEYILCKFSFSSWISKESLKIKIWYFYLFIIAGVGAYMIKYQTDYWYPEQDMSNAHYIEEYGKALVSHIPQGSLLITTYDLQWTVLRYLTLCEGFRTDLTILHQPMMTYSWWYNEIQHYPHVQFPGSHLISGKDYEWDKGYDKKFIPPFTISQFVELNMNNFPELHIAGKLTKPDVKLFEKFEEVSLGLTSKITRKTVLEKMNLDDIYNDIINSWKSARKSLPLLPIESVDDSNKNEDDVFLKLQEEFIKNTNRTIESSHNLELKFREELLSRPLSPTLPSNDFSTRPKWHDQTWEWTIVRDYWMKAANGCEMFTELAIASSVKHGNGFHIARAALLYEEVLANEPIDELNISALKNLGLLYLNIVHKKLKITPQMGRNLFIDPMSTYSSQPSKGKKRIHFFYSISKDSLTTHSPDNKDKEIDETLLLYATMFESRIAAQHKSGYMSADTITTLGTFRLLELWTKWLKYPSAKDDQGYATVKQTIDTLSKIFKKKSE